VIFRAEPAQPITFLNAWIASFLLALAARRDAELLEPVADPPVRHAHRPFPAEWNEPSPVAEPGHRGRTTAARGSGRYLESSS